MRVSLLLITLLFATFVQADVVKKSRSGICHDENSSSYARTKNYEPFQDIASCLASGGRLPKGYTPPAHDPITEARESGRPFSELYDREAWPHWLDVDGNGRNTRHDMLVATSEVPVTFTSSSERTVDTGKWYCPYSDKYWFKASDLDNDHIVPLAWAHGHGGQYWDESTRAIFANDVEHNLLLVEDNLNQSKGAKSPDEWLPPNHKFRCTYIAMFDFVVQKYGLKYTPAEKRTINRMLTACNSQ